MNRRGFLAGLTAALSLIGAKTNAVAKTIFGKIIPARGSILLELIGRNAAKSQGGPFIDTWVRPIPYGMEPRKLALDENLSCAGYVPLDKMPENYIAFPPSQLSCHDEHSGAFIQKMIDSEGRDDEAINARIDEILRDIRRVA